MKIRLSELHPNPFKKEINGGKLNEEQIEKLTSNLDKLKLMGSLPCVKRDNKYFLVAGHHRVEALKRKFGKDYEIEVTIHNYNDDELFRGMVIENLSQRQGEFHETKDNVVACRDYLKDNKEILNELRGDSPRNLDSPKGGNPYKDKITANDISEWLDKATERVLTKDDILDYLNINDNLDKSLQDIIELKHNKSKEERDNPDTINKTQAKILARIIDKKEQKDLANALKNSQEQRVREQDSLVSVYKDSTPEIKEKVRKGEMDIVEVKLEKLKNENKDRYDEAIKSQDNNIKIIRTAEILQNVREEITNTTKELDRFFYKVKAIKFAKLSWGTHREKKDFGQFVEIAIKKAKNWVITLERIKDEVEYEN